MIAACVKPEVPDNPGTDPGTDPGPEEPQIEIPAKPCYIWVDAAANFPWFCNDEAYIKKELTKLADCGFTDVVVDVRPTEGTVLWNSSVAPRAGRLPSWNGGRYHYEYRTAGFDYLKAFLDAGHELGLRVHAAINTFVGGHGGWYGLESEGPLFSGDIPAEWASVDNTTSGPQSSFYPGVQGTVFLNPANDKVQEYILSLIKELAAYRPDGIVLDRCRYSDAGLRAEFSDESKAKFTEYLGREPAFWPVMDASGNLPTPVSSEQKAWLSFRVKTIHDFVEKTAATVHELSPDTKFGVYVGAWYSSYYPSGVNWASPRYLTHAKYARWADADYHNYGFADHCDFMLLGCYAASSSIYGEGEWTMEGFCKQAQKLLLDDTVFAGGPDVGNPEGWQYGGKSAYIPRTVDACINNSDGYFVFDLCHIREFDYWSDFKKAFAQYNKPLTQ